MSCAVELCQNHCYPSRANNNFAKEANRVQWFYGSLVDAGMDKALEIEDQRLKPMSLVVFTAGLEVCA